MEHIDRSALFSFSLASFFFARLCSLLPSPDTRRQGNACSHPISSFLLLHIRYQIKTGAESTLVSICLLNRSRSLLLPPPSPRPSFCANAFFQASQKCMRGSLSPPPPHLRLTQAFPSCFITSSISLPSCAGERVTWTPAFSSASNFPAAVPLPPEMMAPAWPVCSVGGRWSWTVRI